MWRVSETSAWGFRASGYWRTSWYNALEDEERIAEEWDSGSHTAFYGLSCLRFRPSPPGRDVAGFLSLGLDVRFFSSEGTRPEKVVRSDSASLEVWAGFGARWQPFERVGVWVGQKALALAFDAHQNPGDPYLLRLTLRGGVGWPVVRAYF